MAQLFIFLILEFEYNPQFHNVMRVTHAMYKTCNASLPIESYTTGNDSITITTRGHHFFLCGVPGHCQSGQKVDINVPRVSAASIAPTPSALVSPSTDVKPPSPSSNTSAAVAAIKGHDLVLLALQAVVLSGFWFLWYSCLVHGEENVFPSFVSCWGFLKVGLKDFFFFFGGLLFWVCWLRSLSFNCNWAIHAQNTKLRISFFCCIILAYTWSFLIQMNYKITRFPSMRCRKYWYEESNFSVVIRVSFDIQETR